MQLDNYYAPFYEIEIEGSDIRQNVTKSITSFSFTDNIDGADTFSLQVDNHDLYWISREPYVFAEGNEVRITFGYAGGKTSYLVGEISSVSVGYSSSGYSTLTVTGYDLSCRLMRGKITEPFTRMSDSQIVQIMAARARLVPDVQETSYIHENIGQRDQSDFAFIKDRAEKLGFEFRVFADPGTGENKLFFKEPQDKVNKGLVLEWGKNLVKFNYRVNIAGQIDKVVVGGYTEKEKRRIESTAIQKPWVLKFLAPKALERIAKGSGNKSQQTIDDEMNKSQDLANKRAKAELRKITDKLVSGGGECAGMPAVRAGSVVDIMGIGARFSGAYYITSSTHTIGSGGYTTSFNVVKRSG